MNWFSILKEQRQVSRNIQSFRPIQLDKPIKINKPEDSCEEKFIERARTAAIAIGFNSFNPYEVAQRYDKDIQLENHRLNVKFSYLNGSSAFKNRSPTPTDALANWGTYLNLNKDVTDDLFCWMMNEYDKLGEEETNTSKKGPFDIFNQNYTTLERPFLFKINQMNMFKSEPNKRVLSLIVMFTFNAIGEYSTLTHKEINMYIKKHFPNWRGGL